MSRGIVKNKPLATGKGSLVIQEITPPNTFSLTIGVSELFFQNPEPAFSVLEGSIVECDILAGNSCKVTRLIQG